MAQFDQPQEGMVRIAIVDMIGREVRFVTEGRFTAGRHTIPIDMSGLPSGVYFVRVHVRETAATAPIVLMR